MTVSFVFQMRWKLVTGMGFFREIFFKAGMVVTLSEIYHFQLEMCNCTRSIATTLT